MLNIYIRTHGGLGNQLYQVNYALLLRNRLEAKLFLWHDDNYYHKFKLANCFHWISQLDYVPIILKTRFVKLLNKICMYCSIESLRIGSFIYLDGYFHKSKIYASFSKFEKQCVLYQFRNEMEISDSWKEEPLLHLRMGDFFKNEAVKIKVIDKMLSALGSSDIIHCVTNEERLVCERLKFKKCDVHLVKTAGLSSLELLRLMSSYKSITSNGSTLATWAAILGKSRLTSTWEQEEFVRIMNE